MLRFRKATLLAVAVLVALLPLTAGVAYLFFRLSAPATSGQLVVPGLQAPVEVIRDRWGVPHVYAQNEDDLFFAQGYVQAQDRLWQMEVYRRAARGTLAELLGRDALASDRLARTLGFWREAEKDWMALDSEVRRLLEAYARGVNAFLSAPGGRLPCEFSLLGVTPAPWVPQDTLAWAKLLAWSMESGWEREIVALRLVGAVGLARAAQLDPVLADGDAASWQAVGRILEQRPLLMEDARGAWPWAAGGAGGNAWIAWSASGQPLLAADLHTPPQMPSQWYEMHLAGGRYDVIGATVPGVPCVFAGRNRHLVWSMVGTEVDSADLYVERVRAGTPPQAEYEGWWEPLEVREEGIRVRGEGDPVRWRVYVTRHGPLVTDPVLGDLQVALHWAGAGRPAAWVRCLPALNRAAGWADFQTALQDWTAPALTMVCADVAGHVGYMAPEREAGDGRLPVPGWMAAAERMATTTSPAFRTRLCSPGQPLIAVGGALIPGDGSAAAPDSIASFAAGRVAELLGAGGAPTLEAAGAIQCDLRGPRPAFLDGLLALSLSGWILERTTPYLRDWDLSYDRESPGAGVYETFYWRLVHNTLDDELGVRLVDSYLNACPSHRDVMARLSAVADSPWFDDLRTSDRETRDDIIARSYADAADWLGRRFGDLPYEWNWGRVHNVTFSHVLGRQWPRTLFFSRGAMRAGGGPTSLVQTETDYASRLVVRTMPGYRLIVELGENGRAVAVNAPGQAGDPVNPHYADMIEPWREGRYHPLLYEREEILRVKEGVLTLSPAR